MNKHVLISLLWISGSVFSQTPEVKIISWLPSLNTKVNGFGCGLTILSLKEDSLKPTTIINGVGLELIGLGIILPIAPSSPIYTEPDSLYHIRSTYDSIVNTYNSPKYVLNGLAVSPGGIAGYDIEVNGLNLSGINTLTSKVRGVSTGIMFNFSGVINGVSISIIGNEALEISGVQIGAVTSSSQVKGIQIGLFNRTERLHGFQLGLWNRVGKRAFPFLNWRFRKDREWFRRDSSARRASS